MLLKSFSKESFGFGLWANALRAQMAGSLASSLLHLELLLFSHVNISMKALFFAQVVDICNCVISSPITRKSTQREHLQRNC